MLTWLCRKQFSFPPNDQFSMSLVYQYKYTGKETVFLVFSKAIFFLTREEFSEASFRYQWFSVISDFYNPEIRRCISVGHQIRRRILELPYHHGFMYILSSFIARCDGQTRPVLVCKQGQFANNQRKKEREQLASQRGIKSSYQSFRPDLLIGEIIIGRMIFLCARRGSY